jgi:hypothetical protein
MESITPAYVAWHAGTATLSYRPAKNRFLVIDNWAPKKFKNSVSVCESANFIFEAVVPQIIHIKFILCK